MNHRHLQLIHDDERAFSERGDAIASAFYACLFELEPEVRSLFPDDLVAQRGKLIDELRALVDLADRLAEDAGAAFTARAAVLGARHREYGATPAHYRLVGAALLHALESELDGWDEDHREAWSQVYAVVSTAMMAGDRSQR